MVYHTTESRRPISRRLQIKTTEIKTTEIDRTETEIGTETEAEVEIEIEKMEKVVQKEMTTTLLRWA